MLSSTRAGGTGMGDLRWGRGSAGVWHRVEKAPNPAGGSGGAGPEVWGRGWGARGVPALPRSRRQRASLCPGTCPGWWWASPPLRRVFVLPLLQQGKATVAWIELGGYREQSGEMNWRVKWQHVSRSQEHKGSCLQGLFSFALMRGKGQEPFCRPGPVAGAARAARRWVVPSAARSPARGSALRRWGLAAAVPWGPPGLSP